MRRGRIYMRASPATVFKSVVFSRLLFWGCPGREEEAGHFNFVFLLYELYEHTLVQFYFSTLWARHFNFIFLHL